MNEYLYGKPKTEMNVFNSIESRGQLCASCNKKIKIGHTEIVDVTP